MLKLNRVHFLYFSRWGFHFHLQFTCKIYFQFTCKVHTARKITKSGNGCARKLNCDSWFAIRCSRARTFSVSCLIERKERQILLLLSRKISPARSKKNTSKKIAWICSTNTSVHQVTSDSNLNLDLNTLHV